MRTSDMGKLKTLAHEISLSRRSETRDFDPEDESYVSEREATESEREECSDDQAGTEHYVPMGKSKLRRPEEINLGPRYIGSQISRQAVFADIEDDFDESLNDRLSCKSSDSFVDLEIDNIKTSSTDEGINSYDAPGKSDDLLFSSHLSKKIFSIKEISKDSIETRNEAEDHQSSDNDTFSGVSHTENGESFSSDSIVSNREDKEKKNVSEIQKIMKDDQKALVLTLSQAAKADAEKGMAIKLQRMRFNSLLSMRMGLQKALVAVNSLTALQKSDIASHEEPYKAAEEAAVKLWNMLNNFRSNLPKPADSHETAQKRKHDSDQTLSSTMWCRMQKLDVTSIHNQQKTLEKWSIKARSIMTQPLTERFNTIASQQSIVSILNDQLENTEQLVRRTKMPRSCAPVQRDMKRVEDPRIYDDGYFYQVLLKEFVEQQKSESLTMPLTSSMNNKNTQWIAIKEPKVRKFVDTRASKGRRMRFTVHEKLQNFAAPDDRSSWEQTAVSRLFVSLLGQKIDLDKDSLNGANEAEVEEENCLQLFRS